MADILSDKNAILAAFSQPEMDGTFTGAYAAYLKEISQRRPVLLFAFPPKSAGTFLCTAAVVASGGHLVRAVHAQGGREAQLYLPIFIYYYNGGVCEGPMGVHAHMLARPGNCRFFEALNLKPIVMIRPVPDMLASLCDMFSTQPVSRHENISGVVPEAFPDFSPARKAEYLISMVAPWYVNYYASWLEYAAADPERVLILNYTDLLKAPLAMLRQSLAHVGLSVPEAVCQAALDGVWKLRGEVRFNKGVAGRGKSYFSPEQISRIGEMMDLYSGLAPYRNALL